MKLGIILQSNKPEHVLNTFRLGITSLKASHQVEIFLMREGSALDTIPHTKLFHIDTSKRNTKPAKVRPHLILKKKIFDIRWALLGTPPEAEIRGGETPE